jgi:hypothetical protein
MSETMTPSSPGAMPSVANLVTEDDTPVDNIFSEKQERLFVEPLYSSWPGRGPAGFFLQPPTSAYSTQ